jgi:RNA polymerase sigma factor (sigma-70 family)
MLLSPVLPWVLPPFQISFAYIQYSTSLFVLQYRRRDESLISETSDETPAKAVGDAFTTYRHGLVEYLRRRIRDVDEAEDLVQDVFYQLASSFSVAEPIENLSAWLFTVARNKLTDWYRKRRKGVLPQSYTGDGPEASSTLEDILFDPHDEPDQVYWRSTMWEEFVEALDDLPPAQREVFVWHELEGRSFKEISELTGEPVNTLLSRKRYAVLALREQLQELYDELKST